MQTLLNIIATNPQKTYKWLEATAGFQMGLSARTFKSYIDQLLVIGKIKRSENGLWIEES